MRQQATPRRLGRSGAAGPAAVLLLVLALAGCQERRPAGDTGPVAFQVGDRRVGAAEIDAFVRMNVPAADLRLMKDPQARKKVVETLEQMFLLGQRARRAGLAETDEFRRLLRLSEEQILTRLYLRREIEQNTRVTEAEAQAYYRAHPGEFTVDRARVAHILVTDPARAQVIAGLLKADPGAFPRLAAEHSQDARSRAAGGDLGWIARGQTLPEFDQAVFRTPVGGIAGPVRTRYGFHLLRVAERQSGARPFDEVKSGIEERLLDRKRAETLERILEAARRETPVKEFPAVIEKDVAKGF
ncbi:MAG: peptidylprolyl isomerase [Acidobacteria bacterium]|nr:peptidylprolyl isomerase [Acidobacteriota bacterium]